jgi:hypothetical protein
LVKARSPGMYADGRTTGLVIPSFEPRPRARIERARIDFIGPFPPRRRKRVISSRYCSLCSVSGGSPATVQAELRLRPAAVQFVLAVVLQARGGGKNPRVAERDDDAASDPGQAAPWYLKTVALLSAAQNTGLGIGEERRTSKPSSDPFGGAPLKMNPASGRDAAASGYPRSSAAGCRQSRPRVVRRGCIFWSPGARWGTGPQTFRRPPPRPCHCPSAARDRAD